MTIVRYETWKMRDGTEIRITDMEDSHLVNTINMVRRKANKMMEEDNIICWEPEDAPEPEWYLHPRYKTLLAEAHRRGIKI